MDTAPRPGAVPSWPRRIGILGGLGPFAHIDFERHLLEAATRHLGRLPRDQEFPHWILASLPYTPDRSTAVTCGTQAPVPVLRAGLRLLDGADFAVIACNTAHHFLDDLRRSHPPPMPILDIVAETVDTVRPTASTPARVGLVASPGTLASGLYQRAARARRAAITFVTPLDLGASARDGARLQTHGVTEVIFGTGAGRDPLRGGIKAGAHVDRTVRRRLRARLETVLDAFDAAGVRTVILGCTELPLVLGEETHRRLRLVNPMRVAADAAVLIAAGLRALPPARRRRG